jgi:hypothetical protein
MPTAQKILLIYGVVVLVYGCLLGFAMASARSTSPAAPRNLTTTHVSALMQASLSLSLAYAVTAADFTGTAANAGAVLLVAGGVLEQTGSTINWLQNTGDQFAERSLGFKFMATSGPLLTIGAVILAIGVISGIA